MAGSVQEAVPQRASPLPTRVGFLATSSPASAARFPATSTPGSCGSLLVICGGEPFGDELRTQVDVDLAQGTGAAVHEAMWLLRFDHRHLARSDLAL